ncbi:tRNA (pseudouridine(54)-N(1))-methyltransferase TrmY [Halococcus morrhuae DSM 1307]|uniref:tRNA (pseudouridine(54)-N(1))-methyltransferase TrmY n=1 Tax=Halococcus morrhuae TaxID=2250 RepID=UPI003F85AEE1
MRQFVVLGHEVPLTADLSLDDLTGVGRLDVLCRCVTSAFCLSHAIRENTRVWLVLQDEFTIRFEGSELRNLNPDERSTAALVRGALDEKDGAIGHMAAESSPGVSISRRGLAGVLDELDGTLLELHEAGEPVVESDVPRDPAFVLSDHRNFTAREADLLTERADRRVRLGPERLHADHAITVAHNWLDTGGFARY